MNPISFIVSPQYFKSYFEDSLRGKSSVELLKKVCYFWSNLLRKVRFNRKGPICKLVVLLTCK
jgi:hypothetical protein